MEQSLESRIDALVAEHSMPEMVEALVVLSRRYEEALAREQNGEHQGWGAWERALTAALVEVEGPNALDDLG